MERLYNLLTERTEKRFNEFTRLFNGASVATAYGSYRALRLISNRLHSDINDLKSDLRGACNLGFINSEEFTMYCEICNDKEFKIIANCKDLIDSRFGEKESFIGDRMANFGDTREEAEKWWDYINED